MKQIPLAIASSATHGFADFMVGANAPLIEHLRSLGPDSAPTYLWGAAGSGKTHLLHALVGRFDEQGLRAGGFDSNAALPWRFDDAWSLVALDDCDRFDAERQHAAFALFVEAATRNATVVATGRVPPVDLQVREDLRTRLGWGHVFAVAPLGEAETRAALRREADRRGVFLSDEVMHYVLTRQPRDLKHLMTLLDRLDDFSLATRRVITVPLVKQMLAEPAE